MFKLILLCVIIGINLYLVLEKYFMKSKKNLIIGILSLILLCAVVIGIRTLITGSYAGNYQRSIYNDNSKIASKGDSYSFLNRVCTNEDNKTSLEFTFTGMDTIWKLETSQDTSVNIEYKSEISSGKFKVVLINPDGEVINILEQSTSGDKDVNLINGKSRIKIVGNNARGKLQLSISSNKDVKLIPVNN